MRIGDDALGVTVDLPVSLVDDLARKIIESATPEIRLLVAQERTRITEGVWKSLPFAGASVLAFLGTIFLLPDEKLLKFAGYAVSAGLLVGGVFVFLAHAKGTPAPATASMPAVMKGGQQVYPIKISL